MKISIKKLLSVYVSACFMVTSFSGQAAASIAGNKNSAEQYKQIFSDFMLPYSYGKITDARFASTDRVIINIQDLHCHPKVQKNISNIIGLFDKRYGVKTIYLEGAYGDIDTSWINKNAGSVYKDELLDKMIETGRLTGAEYYSALSGKTNIIKGLESKEPYLENLKRFGEILENKEKIELILKSVDKSTQDLKNKYYDRRQFKLEQLAKNFADGKINSEKYYVLLSKHINKLGIDIYKYENTLSYINLLTIQSDLKYAEITGELQNLVLLLKEQVPFNAYKMLLDSTGNFSQVDKLYGYLVKITKQYNLDLSVNYPELNKYFGYIELSQKINPLDLITEEKNLINEMNTRFSETKAQRDVVFMAKFERYLEDYLTSKITKDDYEYYAANIGRYKRLWDKYVDNRVLHMLDIYMAEADEFYKINTDRNEYFTKNITEGVVTGKIEAETAPSGEINKILDNMRDVKRVDVIITGGFHTASISRILDNQKLSYIVITPNVSDGTKYAEDTYYKIVKEQSKISFQTLANLVASLSPADQIKIWNIADPESLRSSAYYKENREQIERILSRQGTLAQSQMDSIKELLRFIGYSSVLESDDKGNVAEQIIKIIKENLGKNNILARQVDEDLLKYVNTEKLAKALKEMTNAEAVIKQALAKRKISDAGVLKQSLMALGNLIDGVKVLIEKGQVPVSEVENLEDAVKAGSALITSLQKILAAKIITLLFKGIEKIDGYTKKSGAYIDNFKKYIESLGWEFDPGTADVVYSGYKGDKYKAGGAPKLKEIIINKELIDARNAAAKHSIFKFVENVRDESGKPVFKISYYEIPRSDSSISGYDMLRAVNEGRYKPFLVMKDQYLLTPSRNLKEILKKDKSAEEQRLIDLLYDPAYGIYVCQKIDTEDGENKFIISSVDSHVDSGVWGTMIDTVLASSILAGLKGKFPNVMELGSGAGHISASISQLPGVENVYFTDISPFALALSKANIAANNPDVDLESFHPILGPGMPESDFLFDLLVANPPYVDEPPNLRGEMDLTAYGGTKFLKEILEKLTRYLNGNNPDAQAILSVSSTTRQALERYLAELGYEFIFEQVGESKRVPFKVYKVLGNEKWINWLAEEGMVYPNSGYQERGEEPYYHDLAVYRVRLITSQVKAKDAQNAKAAALERFKNLNPTRGPSITDEEFDGALNEAFGDNSRAKTKFLNDLAFEGSIKYQIWHTYLSNIPNITLAQQIKLMAAIIKIVETGNYNQKAISIDLRGLETTEESSYLQYLLNQSIDNIATKLSTKIDNGTIRIFTSLANKKFKKAQECISLLKVLKISLPELTGVLLELMDEDISNIDLDAETLKKKIAERIRETIKTAKKEKGVKTEFQYEDIDNMKTYNSWTRKYQDYITTIINLEMDKSYGTKEDKINNLIEIFGGYKSLDSMQATALFNLYRENGSFAALIKLYENVGEYAVEFKESLAIKEFYFVAFNKTKNFETTIEKLSGLSQEKNGELYGSLGKAYYERFKRLRKEYVTGKNPQLLEQMKQALKDSYDAYNDGYLLDYYYYPGINAVYRAIELAELETDEMQKKHWQDKAEDLAELVYLSTEKAGGIRSGDYWTLITMVEAMAISGKYADTAEFSKMQNILNKALEFVTAGWEVDSTLSNLEPLLNRKQDTPYAENLEAIVNRLYLKKLELLIPSFDENMSKLEKTGKNDPKYESVKTEYENTLKQIKEAMSNNPARTYNEEEIIDIIGLLSKSRYYGSLKDEIKQSLSEETFSRLEKEGKAKRKADVADKKTTKSGKFTKALLAFCYRFPVFSLDIFQTKSISGNYQYGGGLQEMMLGREDIKIAEQIIKDLDLENTDDIDVFMARIDEIIRRQYRNDELHLEDLKSEGHGRFDDSIKAIQELTASGRTTDSRTNIMLDFLLGIGDCRQHGETKQILFEVWKEMRIKGYFVDARTAIEKGDTQVAATSFEKIRQLLKKQMFTMEALVTGNVAMNGKYNVFKDKDGNPIKSDKVNDIEEHVLTVLVELDDEGNVVMDKDGNFVNGSFRLADSFYQHEYKFGWGQLDIKAEDCSVGEDGKLIIKAGTTENGLDIFLTEPKVEYAGHESRVESRSKKGKLNNVFGLLYRGLPSVTSLLSRMFDVRKEYIAGHAIELIRSKNKSDDSVLRKSFDMFSSSLLQYYRNIVKKLDRGVFDGIINGLKEFMEIKDDSTIQITDEMLSKYAIAGLPDFETFIKELNLNPEQSLKLAEVFHNYGYYEDIRKNEIDNRNSPVIDMRLLDSNFNPNAEKLLSCLTDQAREVIEKRHSRSAREKIKLTIFDIKDSKMAEFFELAVKTRPDSLIEARRYIDKNARSWYEAGYLSEDGKKKIEAGNTNLTKNDFTKDGFENIDKSIIKKAETPVVNTLQVRWEYLQQDIGKYEVLNKKGEWLRKESLQKQEERKQFLIEQQTSGVVVTIATLMYLKNHNITDGLLALKLIHAGWSVNNKWDLLAKAHYDDLSVEEKRKDLIYLEAVSKFLLFDQDHVIAKMLESARESLSIGGAFVTMGSNPAVILSQSGTKQATNAIKLVNKDGKTVPVEINSINDIKEAIDWSSSRGFNELTIVIGAIDTGDITDKTSDEQRLAWLNKILKLTASQNNKDLRDYALSKGISLSIHCFSFTKDVIINGERKQILPTPGFNENWAQMHELQLQIAESLGIKSVVVHAINDLSGTNIDAWVKFVKSAGSKGITVNFENDFKYIAPTNELFDKSRIAGYIGYEAFIEFLDKIKSKLSDEERLFFGVTLDTTKALSSFTAAAQSRDEKIKNLTFENLVKYINAVLSAGYKINIVHLSQFDTSKAMPVSKDTGKGIELEIAYDKSGIDKPGVITPENLKVLLELLRRQNPQIVILQETQTDVVPMSDVSKQPESGAESGLKARKKLPEAEEKTAAKTIETASYEERDYTAGKNKQLLSDIVKRTVSQLLDAEAGKIIVDKKIVINGYTFSVTNVGHDKTDGLSIVIEGMPVIIHKDGSVRFLKYGTKSVSMAQTADETKFLNRDLKDKSGIESSLRTMGIQNYAEVAAGIVDVLNKLLDFQDSDAARPDAAAGGAKLELPDAKIVEALKQVKTAVNTVNAVQKTAISIVIGEKAVENLSENKFDTKETLLVISDSLKAEDLILEGLNVAVAVKVQKDEKEKLKGSKKIGTIGNYNGAAVRAYWNEKTKRLMFYSKEGLDGADLEVLKEMFASMQTEGIKADTFKGISQVVVTDKENYDETIKAMENLRTDAQAAIMIVKGIELDLTKRTGKINETICKNECTASGSATFVISEQQAAENSRDIEKMQKAGYKFIVKHAAIIGAESVMYDGAKIDAGGLKDYNRAIKLLEGLRTKALAKGGISVKFSESVYKMFYEAGIDVWQRYGIIPVVSPDSAYINGQIGKVEVEGITEQNIDSILSKDSVMTIVVDNAEILSDRKDAVKEAKTAKGKQKKEYKAVLNGNIPYAFNVNGEAEVKRLISEIADIIEEDLTEEPESAGADRRAKVVSLIENIRQTSFYGSLNEKAKSRIDHLMKDKDAVQKTAAFIRAVALRTAEEMILSEMKKNGIDIKTEEFRKFQDGRFREGILIRAVQLLLSGQNVFELLSAEFIDSDNVTAEEYMNAIMSKAEGVASNIGAICIKNEYTIRPEKDAAAAIDEFKEFNVLLQDRFRQIGINKEMKISIFAVKSILSAA